MTYFFKAVYLEKVNELEKRVENLRNMIMNPVGGAHCSKGCHREIDMCFKCDAIRLIHGCDRCADNFSGCEPPFSEAPCEWCVSNE